MKVVLLKRYQGLGYQNDVITVADGYARNFLIPMKIAVYASEGAIKMAEENVKQGERKRKLKIEEATKLADRIKSLGILIKVNVDKNDKLFSNVSDSLIKKTIAEVFKYDVESVILDAPIDKLGPTEVKVKVYIDVVTDAIVNVEKK